MMVWIDTETTGLDPKVDQLLEVAVVITDDILRTIATASYVLRAREPIIIEDNKVLAMHAENGLFAEVAKSTLDTGKVAAEIRDLIELHLPSPGYFPPLCGSTVGFDREFLRQHMPDLLPLLSYRNIDVSSIKLLVQLWAPAVYEGWKTFKRGAAQHRALPDICNSITELSYYREHFLKLEAA